MTTPLRREIRFMGNFRGGKMRAARSKRVASNEDPVTGARVWSPADRKASHD